MQAPNQAVLDAFTRIVGAEHAIRDATTMAPYLVELRNRYHGKAAMVLRPGDTTEVWPFSNMPMRLAQPSCRKAAIPA